jgi:hypothetical protein
LQHSEPELLSWLATVLVSLLPTRLEARPTHRITHYPLGSNLVCQTAFRLAFGLQQHKLSKARAMANMGNTVAVSGKHLHHAAPHSEWLEAWCARWLESHAELVSFASVGPLLR